VGWDRVDLHGAAVEGCGPAVAGFGGPGWQVEGGYLLGCDGESIEVDDVLEVAEFVVFADQAVEEVGYALLEGAPGIEAGGVVVSQVVDVDLLPCSSGRTDGFGDLPGERLGGVSAGDSERDVPHCCGRFDHAGDRVFLAVDLHLDRLVVPESASVGGGHVVERLVLVGPGAGLGGPAGS